MYDETESERRDRYSNWPTDAQQEAADAELAARINNDRQALMAEVERIALGWQRDGLLERITRRDFNHLDEVGHYVERDLTGLAAVGFLARVVDQTLAEYLKPAVRSIVGRYDF